MEAGFPNQQSIHKYRLQQKACRQALLFGQEGDNV
jgi:hypothetical protein